VHLAVVEEHLVLVDRLQAVEVEEAEVDVAGVPYQH
jgi:hypothetical protein